MGSSSFSYTAGILGKEALIQEKTNFLKLFIVPSSVKYLILTKLRACNEHVHTFSEFGMKRKVFGYKLGG